MNIETLKSKQYWGSLFKKNARILWSLGLSLLFTELFRLIYFKNSPLLEIQFLAEFIIFLLLFMFFYYLGRKIIFYVSGWLEKVVGEFLRKVLYDFWRSQSTRMAEAIKKESTEESIKPVYSSIAKAVLLDTSAIIDGRILGVITTGFMDNNIIVPQNVVDELKFMADKKDALKREKGRRGLDILREIKKTVGKNRFFLVDLKSTPEKVDDSLVEYCKKHNTMIATVDYNLNKAAQVASVTVLNVNKLANEVKTELLPGEMMSIKLVQKGKEESQAVGYLDDGTMIVVKNSADYVGDTKEIVVDKVLQTSAGRMIFASIYANIEESESN